MQKDVTILWLTSAENYCPGNKNMLPLKKSAWSKLEVEAVQVYLLGNQLTIQTDHRAFQWLTKFKDSTNKLL